MSREQPRKERLKKKLKEREKQAEGFEKKDCGPVTTGPAQTLNPQPGKIKSIPEKAPEASSHLLNIGKQNLDLAITFIFQLRKPDLVAVDVKRLLIRAFGLFNAATIILGKSDITPESSSNLAIAYWNLAWITEIFKEIDCHYAKAESTKVYFDKAVTTNAKATFEEALNRSHKLMARGSFLYDDFKKRCNEGEGVVSLSYVLTSAKNYNIAGINILKNIIDISTEEMLRKLNLLIALCFTQIGIMYFALDQADKYVPYFAVAWQFYKNVGMLSDPSSKIKIQQLAALYSAAKQLLPNTKKEDDFLFRPINTPFADEESSKSFSF